MTATTTELRGIAGTGAISSDPLTEPESRWPTDVWRVVAAVVIGAGVALSGFPPLNHIPGEVQVLALPGFTLLTPAVLLALLAITCSRPAISGPIPQLVVLALGLTGLGAVLSLFSSANPDQSASYVVLAVLAPAVLFIAVWRGGLPGSVLAGSFLTALTAVLVRADIVFLKAEGLPTASKLFYAKFANQAHDFHYDTLGNPDHTSIFLLLPFTLTLVWASRRDQPARTRALLLFAALVMLVTLVFLYVRLNLLIAVIMVLAAVLASPWPRRVRVGIVAASVAAVGAFALASPGHYLAQIFSTKRATSGEVRINSISAGLRTLLHHPLTGVGIGQYGGNGSPPAHSLVIQAGAEMGIWGLTGLALITIALPLALLLRLHRRTGGGASSASRSWFTLPNAALAAAAVYVLAAAASAPEGLFVGTVSIYAMTLALFAGIGLTPVLEPAHVPVREAFRSAAADLRERLAGRFSGRVRTGWLLYCAVWILVAAWVTSGHVGTAVITGSRLTDLRQLTAASAHGYGPFVQMTAPGKFIPAGLGDDPGQYLIFPWLSSLLGTTDAFTIYRTVFVACLALTVAIYPLFVRRLTGSIAASLVSPLIVLVVFGFLVDYGFYWAPALMIAICLPWLLILLRERAAPLFSLTVIAAIAGTTSMFRGDTGYGVLAAAAIVCLLAWRPWRIKAVGVALLVAAYVFFSSGVLSLEYQARAERMASFPVLSHGVAGVTRWSQGSNEPLWHTIYISLGYIPNPYGIHYVDASAQDYVQRVDPSAPYLSPRYETILRRRVLQILSRNPGFVAHVESVKLRDTLANGLSQVPLLLLVLPIAAALALGRRRRPRQAKGPPSARAARPGAVWVILPVAVLAILPTLISVPVPTYELSWEALLGTFTVLCAAWLVALFANKVSIAAAEPRFAPAFGPLITLGAELEHRGRGVAALLKRSGRTTYDRLEGWAAIVAGPVARVLRAVSAGTRRFTAAVWALVSDQSLRSALASGIRSRVAYLAVGLIVLAFVARDVLVSTSTVPSSQAVSAPTLPYNAALGHEVRRWDSNAALASIWLRGPSVARSLGTGMVDLITEPTNLDYALISPDVVLAPGRYVVVVRGEIYRGGLVLGALDVGKQQWLATTGFTRATAGRWSTMPLTFTVPSKRTVKIILSNLSPANHRSIWWISQVVLSYAP